MRSLSTVMVTLVTVIVIKYCAMVVMMVVRMETGNEDDGIGR